MGLDITVGVLADLLEHDAEGAEWILDQLADVNKLLGEKLFIEHVEPRDCEVWTAEGYGYSGVHALREVARLTWRGLPIPRDNVIASEFTPNGNALFLAALPRLADKKPSGFLQRFLRKKILLKISSSSTLHAIPMPKVSMFQSTFPYHSYQA